jgi:formylglycine-generating enzyme required for sulfatase activity
VLDISWDDAKEYVARVSHKTGKTYRLLSEAEWEYAARVGTATRYAFGDTIGKTQAQLSRVIQSTAPRGG